MNGTVSRPDGRDIWVWWVGRSHHHRIGIVTRGKQQTVRVWPCDESDTRDKDIVYH